MSARTITVSLPEELYAQLALQAHNSARSVDDLAAQTIAQGIVIAAEPELPPAVQTELAAMEQLSDDALWNIAASTASKDTIALYDLLTERQVDGQLTPQGQRWLEQVREETETLTLRKAQAYALLKRRGHQMPMIEDLLVPTA